MYKVLLISLFYLLTSLSIVQASNSIIWNIKQIKVNGNKVYLLNEVNQLQYLDLKNKALKKVSIGNGRIIDIHIGKNKKEYLLFIDAEYYSQAKVYIHEKQNHWKLYKRLTLMMKEVPLALTDKNGNIAVITNQRLLVENALNNWNRLEIPDGLMLTYGKPLVLFTKKYLFWGVNLGFMGGTLQMVSLETGERENIGNYKNIEKCNLPLTPTCHAITGIVESSNNSIIVSSVNIKEKKSPPLVQVQFTKRNVSFQSLKLGNGVIGLKKQGNTLWILTKNHLIKKKGKQRKKYKIPHEFQDIHGVSFSTEIPGVILVKKNKKGKADRSGVSLLFDLIQ